MEIRIITVGKIKEKYLNDGIAEYAKRLGRYCTPMGIIIIIPITREHHSSLIMATTVVTMVVI